MERITITLFQRLLPVRRLLENGKEFLQTMRAKDEPFRENSLDDIITDATAGQWYYRKFLRVLFEREVEQRIENRKYGRIRKANFPQIKETLHRVAPTAKVILYGSEARGERFD